MRGGVVVVDDDSDNDVLLSCWSCVDVKLVSNVSRNRAWRDEDIDR